MNEGKYLRSGVARSKKERETKIERSAALVEPSFAERKAVQNVRTKQRAGASENMRVIFLLSNTNNPYWLEHGSTVNRLFHSFFTFEAHA